MEKFLKAIKEFAEVVVVIAAITAMVTETHKMKKTRRYR